MTGASCWLPTPPFAGTGRLAGVAVGGVWERLFCRCVGRSYIAGMAETCRPGSSHGNQMAAMPTATSTTPVAWPKGLP